MKAIATALLVLCHLAVSHGNGNRTSYFYPGPVFRAWNCREAPQLYNVQQIDAGLGSVVARDGNNFPYFLIGQQWQRLSVIRFKHVSVGPAGLWGCSITNRVYKYVAGNFLQSTGQSLQQVDAGGDDHVVGVEANTFSTFCLTSSSALAYSRVGTLSWSPFRRQMRYYSCGPEIGCWGVDRSYNVYVTKGLHPGNCGTAAWTRVIGPNMKMVEVGTDGSVFGVTQNGQVYQRVGITNVRQEGTRWVHITMCMAVRHVSYDLGQLWVVTNSGFVLQCTQ